MSSTAHALRGLEAQQLKLASGLAGLGERLAAESNSRAAEAPALLSRAAEHTRQVAADTLAQVRLIMGELTSCSYDGPRQTWKPSAHRLST